MIFMILISASYTDKFLLPLFSHINAKKQLGNLSLAVISVEYYLLSNSFTIALTWLPSAFPFTRGITAPITLPNSLAEVA